LLILQYVYANSYSSHPGYFGKHGMRHLHLKRNQYYLPTINVENLWTVLTEQHYLKAKENYEKEKDKSKLKAVVIDCNKAVKMKLI
jgi:ribosomal protein L15